MTGLSSALWIVGSYVIVIALIYIIFNFLTKGFISQYMKVKTSRGRLTLIKCNDVTDTYYKAGMIDRKRNLILKDRFKKVHTLTGLSINYVRRELGVNLIEIDLPTDSIINRDFSAVKSYDTTTYDEMVQRAIMLPTLNKDDVWEKAQKLLIFLILIGVAVTVYLLLTQDPVSCSVAVPTDVVNI